MNTQKPPQAPPARKPRIGRTLLLTMLIGSLLVMLILSHRQAIYDWLRLRDYHPPAAIAALAQDDTMTPLATHIFYVNHPVLSSKGDFSKHCPSGNEQTVVLGCYRSDQAGIYVLDVTDARLQGIEQVTAAHEMLHAAYDRLSDGDKQQINQQLTDYFYHGLHDQSIIDTINSYKQSEPNDLVNEMHSIFGTEVSDLPSGLENYYKRYFADRAAIVADYQNYESEFTSRLNHIKQYDTELSSLKQQIDSLESSLNGLQSEVNGQRTALDRERASGDLTSFNAGVPGYNALVDRYNQGVEQVQTLVRRYNAVVAARNAIALEERQLVQSISSSDQQIGQ